jgi:hypothetical protein
MAVGILADKVTASRSQVEQNAAVELFSFLTVQSDVDTNENRGGIVVAPMGCRWDCRFARRRIAAERSLDGVRGGMDDLVLVVHTAFRGASALS